MRKPVRPVVTAAILAAVCSQAIAVEQAATLPKATSDFLQVYQGAQAHMEQGKVRIIYGVPMGGGVTPRDSATAWLTQNAEAFGCGPLQLVEDWSTPVMGGKFTVFGYKQLIDGVPVELGMARVLVLNGPLNQVVYAGGNLAARPDNGFPRVMVDPDTATKIASGEKEAQGLVKWTAPASLTVYQGNGDWTAPVLTWKVTGQSGVDVAKTFFVDASSGRVVSVRDEVQGSDVSGTVQGTGTPGVYPDTATNLPVPMGMSEILTTIVGGSNAYSDRTGAFTIPNAGTADVSVKSSTNASQSGGGRWVNVVPSQGAVISTTATVTPPGPAGILLNASPTQFLTSQVNAYIVASLTHNYFRDRATTFTPLDLAITANVNIASACNAAFNGANLSLNFYNSSGGCVNTAYSTIISHEYGHFILNRLNLAQNAFGEGYGDTNAEMVWNDGVVGRGFNPSDPSYTRDSVAANIQYPCSASCGGEIHCCGQMLSGIWWSIRQNMGTLLGDDAGLEATRNMEVAWSLITTGGPTANNAAGPSTAIQVLTIDDDDGNLSDGTPHYNQICPAFAAHSISCPALAPTAFMYPNGRPASLAAATPTTVAVNISGGSATLVPGSGTVSYRIGYSDPFTTVPMTQGAPNQYTATLPAVTCAPVQYYFSVQTTDGQTRSDPSTAPAAFYGASNTSNTTQVTVADLNFETDPGWTVYNDPSLSTGAWERAIPHTPPSQNCPPADYDGSGNCWVTDNRSGNYDVDGGPTRLTTTTYDLSGLAEADLSYARWIEYTNGTPDPLVVEVSNDNGATWALVESATTTAGWTLKTFHLSNCTALTSQMQFRFTANDTPSDSVTEAALDAFKIIGYRCTQGGCYANCDNSTTPPVLNVIDFTCFLQKFASGDPYANCDNSTTVPVLNVIDFTCFLQKFAAGCP
jgi:hypothetical protein